MLRSIQRLITKRSLLQRAAFVQQADLAQSRLFSNGVSGADGETDNTIHVAGLLSNMMSSRGNKIDAEILEVNEDGYFSYPVIDLRTGKPTGSMLLRSDVFAAEVLVSNE